MNLFYPYQTGFGRLHPTLTLVPLDDQGQAPDQSLRTDIDLRPFARESQVVELRAEVEVGVAASDINVVVVVRCADSNMRQATRLSRVGPTDTHWSGIIEVDLRNYHGLTEALGVVTSTVGGKPNRWVAATPTMMLIVDDEPLPHVQGDFQVEWTPFDGHERFDAHADLPFYLDLADSAMPVLRLNSSIEDFDRILPATGVPTSPLNAFFELARGGIALSARLALFQVALAGIQETETGERSWPTVPWQQRLLKGTLQAIYGSEADDQLLERAAEARPGSGDPFAAADMVQAAVAVLQKDPVRFGRAVRVAVQEVQKFGQEESE